MKPGESLTIVIGGQDDKSPRTRRKGQKPPTLAERKLRLDVHKIHVMCLLYHVFVRNHWCNDSKLQVRSVYCSVRSTDSPLEHTSRVQSNPRKSSQDAQPRRWQSDRSLQIP
jgi:hypothetical protein